MNETEFQFWLNDNQTKKIFSILKGRREEINQQLMNAPNLFSDNYQVESALLVGERTMIDDLVELTYEDVDYQLRKLGIVKDEETVDVEDSASRSSYSD